MSDLRKEWQTHEYTQKVLHSATRRLQLSLDALVACAANTTDPNVAKAFAAYTTNRQHVRELTEGLPEKKEQ